MGKSASAPLLLLALRTLPRARCRHRPRWRWQHHQRGSQGLLRFASTRLGQENPTLHRCHGYARAFGISRLAKRNRDVCKCACNYYRQRHQCRHPVRWHRRVARSSKLRRHVHRSDRRGNAGCDARVGHQSGCICGASLRRSACGPMESAPARCHSRRRRSGLATHRQRPQRHQVRAPRRR